MNLSEYKKVSPEGIRDLHKDIDNIKIHIVALIIWKEWEEDKYDYLFKDWITEKDPKYHWMVIDKMKKSLKKQNPELEFEVFILYNSTLWKYIAQM